MIGQLIGSLTGLATSIIDGKGVVGFVWDNLDLKIWLSFKLLWFGDRVVSNLVKGIRSVRDEFSKEDFLVGIESVDDETHQLLDVSVERKNFFTHWKSVLFIWLNLKILIILNFVFLKRLLDYF